MSNPDAITSSGRYRYFLAEAWVSGLDLNAIGSGPCRCIKVVGAGNLVTQPASAISGLESFLVNDGDVYAIQATKIDASTTVATGLLVF